MVFFRVNERRSFSSMSLTLGIVSVIKHRQDDGYSTTNDVEGLGSGVLTRSPKSS